MTALWVLLWVFLGILYAGGFIVTLALGEFISAFTSFGYSRREDNSLWIMLIAALWPVSLVVLVVVFVGNMLFHALKALKLGPPPRQ